MNTCLFIVKDAISRETVKVYDVIQKNDGVYFLTHSRIGWRYIHSSAYVPHEN